MTIPYKTGTIKFSGSDMSVSSFLPSLLEPCPKRGSILLGNTVYVDGCTDRLCGLVVRGLGFDSRRYQIF